MSKPLKPLKDTVNSFMTKLRVNLIWDHDLLLLIILNLKETCSNSEGIDFSDFEMTSLLWYFSHFVKDWTSHEAFRKGNNLNDDYYDFSYSVIYDMTSWYFMGFCPYEAGGLEKELSRLNSIIQNSGNTTSHNEPVD
jgi:hypothetical protein